MKKVLGLVASQRKLGNGEILTKEVAAAAGEECQLELIRLASLDLKPCRGCYACLAPGKQCPVVDDLYFLTEKIKEADAVILSAPCYALGPSAVAKLLIDRIFALAQLNDVFVDKPAVVVATAGVTGWEGYTASALNAAVRLMGFDLKDSYLFNGAYPGEGVMCKGASARAREMGTALFGPSRSAQNGECPTCWSDIWKFPSPGTAVCPLCGQTATLVTDGQDLRWFYGSPSNRFEKEQLEYHLQHRSREMLLEFNSRRQELSEVRNRYKGNDSWMCPPEHQSTAFPVVAEGRSEKDI